MPPSFCLKEREVKEKPATEEKAPDESREPAREPSRPDSAHVTN